MKDTKTEKIMAQVAILQRNGSKTRKALDKINRSREAMEKARQENNEANALYNDLLDEYHIEMRKFEELIAGDES